MKKSIFAVLAVLAVTLLVVPGFAFADEAPAGNPPAAAQAEPAAQPEATPAASCNGVTPVACATGQFCEIPGGSCGATGQPGMCEAIPEVCTEEYAPVCGCNDLTYANDCARKRAGVSRKNEGLCGR